RAHHDRGALEGDRGVTNGLVNELLGDLHLEHRLGERVVVERELVEHDVAVLLRLGGHVLGDLALADVLAVVAEEAVRLHLDEVDHALELVLEPDGELEEDRVEAKLLFELV
ncbi:MAG: hypothetical protein ACK56I_30580, partial [bacterium]